MREYRNALHNLWDFVNGFFKDIPARVQEVNYWFYHISNLAYTLIALLHISWGIAFTFSGVPAMAQIQVVSLACYIAANILNRRGHHMVGMMLAVGEVFGLGLWVSEFHSTYVHFTIPEVR
ncbi:MAG: hypothetical protein EBZ77_01410 [Chitinophagia bacterium]|nr:hypothetical protein [Chitinophagia bacterium]